MIAAAAAWLLCASSAFADSVLISDTHPARFQHRFNPEPLFFAPGNQGLSIFKNESEGDPGNFAPEQDHYCGVMTMELDSDQYDFRLDDADAGSTEPAGYWPRFQGFLYSNALQGRGTELRITGSLMDRLEDGPGAPAAFAALLRDKLFEAQAGAPLLTFDVPEMSAAELALLRALRSELPGVLMGRHFQARAQPPGAPAALPASAAQFDYFIIDEELIPETYRGQAAAAWSRARFGQMPVLLSPAQPDFLRDIAWAGTGAAGVCYRRLPPPGTPGNNRGWRNLRAASVFCGRFGDFTLKLASRPPAGSAIGMLADPGKSFTLFLWPEADGTLPHPAWPGAGFTQTAIWYNPATDENIILPRAPAAPEIAIKPPSAAVWAYTEIMQPVSDDARSTITEIRPWQDLY